jgi:regulator of nucleoside diphosphate kinase
MATNKKQLLIAHNDFQTITTWIRNPGNGAGFDAKDAAELTAELKKAKLVAPEKLPPTVVRLNSKVLVRDEAKKKMFEFTLVPPGKANIAERLVSVLAPLGRALLGFQQGQTISWNMPSGKRSYTIVQVHNTE